jgi:hypothetical protein
MSLLFHEQLFDFYAQVPPPSMVPVNASRSVPCFGCHCLPHSTFWARIIAASLGTYMLMLYFAASVTSSRIEAQVSCQSPHVKRPAQRRRNSVRAESPPATVSGSGKRGLHPVSKSDRFCRTCLIFKPPRYCLRGHVLVFVLSFSLARQMSPLQHLRFLR